MAQREASTSKTSLIVVAQLLLMLIALIGLKWADIEVSVDRDEAIINIAIGLGAGALCYLVLLAVTRSNSPIGKYLRNTVQKERPSFADLSIGAIVAVSFVAAVGEELLFRALIQTWISDLTLPWIGIAAGAGAFALVHASSAGYALLSFVLGALIGTAYVWKGSIVLIISWHFAYDLLALFVLIKSPRTLGLEFDQD